MSQLTINTWFPIAIGQTHCPFINEVQSDYLKIISKFKYNENGFCYEDIHKNKKFSRLNKWITQSVNEYAQAHLYKYKYEAKDSWLLVFYLKASPNDQPTIFSNPFIDMKNPVGLTLTNFQHIKLNDLTYSQCEYPCESGKLVIFRSHILHAVDPKITPEKRIVFSYNFDPK